MKNTFRYIMTVVMAMVLASCGQQTPQDNNGNDGTQYLVAPFFKTAMLENVETSQKGNIYLYKDSSGVTTIKAVQVPGMTTDDLEKSRDTLEKFSKDLIDMSIKMHEVKDLKGLMLVGKSGDKVKKVFASPITDAVIVIMTDPLPSQAFDGTSLFERVLDAFVLTNPDYFKGAPLLPDGIDGNPPDDGQVPGTVTPFKNDYIAFDIPANWEVPATSDLTSIMVVPAIDNSNDSGEGITILAMDRHDMESDLAYAQSFVPKAEWVEFGKNKFAKFLIANQGVLNFVISNETNTYMVTITSNNPAMPEKFAKFLESVVLVKHE